MEKQSNLENEKENFFVRFWWLFPVLNVICSLLTLPSIQHDCEGLASYLIIASFLLIVIQGISILCCVCKKKWRQVVASMISGVVCLIVFSNVSFVFYAYASSLPDTFGKEHPIPEGLIYEIPKSENDDFEPIADSSSSDGYLQIGNDLQGGIYHYSFYYPELPDGEVFLRCFEVTENIELSAPRLQKASTVEVKNHSDFGIVANSQRFTIYEGDWGDYYAARIEVWHKNGNTGKETKLMEKNYRVEGWMR